MRHEDFRGFSDSLQNQATDEPTPPHDEPAPESMATVKFRFYDFETRTWREFTREEAHALSESEVVALIPQTGAAIDNLDYLLHVQRPPLTPFEALLVVLLSKG